MMFPAKLKLIKGEHGVSLDSDFSPRDARKVITQTRYYKAGNVIVAIGELNAPNAWDDPAFDAACEHLITTWNRLDPKDDSAAIAQNPPEASDG